MKKRLTAMIAAGMMACTLLMSSAVYASSASAVPFLEGLTLDQLKELDAYIHSRIEVLEKEAEEAASAAQAQLDSQNGMIEEGDWSVFNYSNAAGQYTGDFAIISKPYEGRISYTNGKEASAYIQAGVCSDGFFFAISLDGTSFLTSTGQTTLELDVVQSTGKESHYTATASANSSWLFMDDIKGSKYIISDMRKKSESTYLVLYNVTGDIQYAAFALPHNSNFKSLFDSVKGYWPLLAK